jgi:hypothetical protein
MGRLLRVPARSGRQLVKRNGEGRDDRLSSEPEQSATTQSSPGTGGKRVPRMNKLDTLLSKRFQSVGDVENQFSGATVEVVEKMVSGWISRGSRG